MKYFKTFILLILLSPLLPIDAADILESTNYVIYNAYSKFSGICLQDDKGLGTNNNYIYSFAPRDTSEQRQEWIFVRSADDSTMYYICNAKTHLYLSGEPSEGSKRNFNKAAFQVSKNKSTPWKITDIGTTGQVEISCTDIYGVHFYLHASDTTATIPNYKNNPILNKNTRFAWRLELAKDTASTTGIHSVQKVAPQISVANRHIKISGATNYDIYDLNGKPVRNTAMLQPGTYLVVINGKTQKVSVK